MIFYADCYLSAQEAFTYKTYDINTPLGNVVDFSEIDPMIDAKILLINPLAPLPLNETQQKKQILDRQRSEKIIIKKGNQSLNKTAVASPQILQNFRGNVSQGTPNDNDMAISNGGYIVSAVNTNINVYNDTGLYITGKTLSFLGTKLGPLNRTYDPRVVYDPEKDRFIVVFLQGSSSTDTRVILAFSQSNDPSLNWNLYQLPGNVWGDSSWSDYPIISLNNNELFITLNRLKDNTFWKNGFIESVIWQIDKNKGFDGDSLNSKIYTDIKYNDKSIWSICPVKGGSKLYGNAMYFLSQRPSDLINDTLFLHFIDNSLASGKAKLITKALKSNVAYGLQPNAIQPNGKKLQTNDARVLSAMYENGVIYYVGNSIDTSLFAPAVYFGVIADSWNEKPTVNGKIISYDSLDIGYPSIAYAGSSANGDHSCMITFSHVSPNHLPGTSVIYVDRNFNISAPVFVKTGEGNIRLIGDSVERWGDYTGIQMKYNELGVCWLSGSYGELNGGNRTWIARVKSKDPLLGTQTEKVGIPASVVYPNPAVEIVSIDFDVNEKILVDVSLTNIKGELVYSMLKDFAKPGTNRLKFNVSNVANGIYFVNIKHNEQVILAKKLIVSH